MAGCGLLACTVAWDAAHNAVNGTTAVSGFSSLGAAVMDAVAALEAVRPPASPSAGAPQVSPGAAQHLPAEIEWGARLSAVHDQLHAVPADTLSDDNTGILKVNPNAALDEYLRNGQQGLDELLAALDAGFQGVVSSSSSESDEEESTGNGAGGGQRKRTRGLTKVVLARRTDVQVEGKVDPISLLEALQERDPRAYQVLLQLPSGATFLSSTPECLYTRTGTAVASEAVAGTRARGAGGDVERDFWLAFDLLQSHKDDVEFGVVRDWVQRTLSTLCDGVKVEVAKSVLKQANVQHLYAKLAGVLRPGAGDAELLSALHPTPAVCGQPRTEALGMLSEVEPFDRGFYSGPFGWVAHDAAEFVVAIRSALVHPDAAVLDRAAGHIADTSSASPHTWSSEYAPHPTAVSLFAGVGIVSGSDVAAEWAELNLKIAQFQRLLVSPKRLDEAPNAAALWARLMVEELCRLGCNTFCVAPGKLFHTCMLLSDFIIPSLLLY